MARHAHLRAKYVSLRDVELELDTWWVKADAPCPTPPREQAMRGRLTGAGELCRGDVVHVLGHPSHPILHVMDVDDDSATVVGLLRHGEWVSD